AEKIGDIDFAMLSKIAPNGTIAARPMSNNGDVEYDGDSFFFAFEQSNTVQEALANPKIGLTFTGSKSVLGAPGIFIGIEAVAEVIRDKGALAQHWNKDIEEWAHEGVDTPGLVLIMSRKRGWRRHRTAIFSILSSTDRRT